jgi:hypothetical protein
MAYKEGGKGWQLAALPELRLFGKGVPEGDTKIIRIIKVAWHWTTGLGGENKLRLCHHVRGYGLVRHLQ